MPTEAVRRDEAAPAQEARSSRARPDRPAVSAGLAKSLTFAAFVAVFVVYIIWLGGLFLNPATRLLDVHSNTPVLLLALSVTVTLLSGQFDLSVGSMATLTAFLTVGLTVRQGWPFWLVLVAVLGVGIVGGLLSGFLVARLRVNAFIATLGTGGVFLGLSAVYSDDQVVSPTNRQLPAWFTGLGQFGHKVPAWIPWLVIALALVWAVSILVRRFGEYSNRRRLAVAAVAAASVAVFIALNGPRWIDAISELIAVLLLVAAVLWILLNQTPYGRNLRATGSNTVAARLAGVHTRRVTIIAFVIGGALASLSGMSLASLNDSAAPGVAVDFLLPAFAAAFLSTVLFSRGGFTVWGTITGGVFVVWVAQGLILGGLQYTWTDVVNGIVLVSAVALSTTFRSRE
jgi:ribose/xylose/arabinose/galactoside ABC-type transport system permease subunit